MYYIQHTHTHTQMYIESTMNLNRLQWSIIVQFVIQFVLIIVYGIVTSDSIHAYNSHTQTEEDILTKWR